MNVAFDLKIEDLLAQAASWRLASLLLERPRPGWRDEMKKLCWEVADQNLAACTTNIADETEEAYHSLFGPGGAVSPREASYCGFEDPGRLMAELNAFYRAFRFEPRREDPIDHIAVEAGFVGYLFLKEAYAGSTGSAEGAAITKRARESFMSEHLLRCAEGINNRLNSIPSPLKNALLWLVQKAGGHEDAPDPRSTDLPAGRKS